MLGNAAPVWKKCLNFLVNFPMNLNIRIRLLILIASILLPALSYAQLPPFQWVGEGSRPSGSTFPQKTLHDDNYFGYLSGGFRDSTDLDPGPGVQMAYSNGAGSYMQKYDPNGTFLFSLYYPTDSVLNAVFMDIVVDVQGNIFAYGFHDAGSIDLDPGPSVVMSPVISVSQRQNFIVKFDPNGNYQTAYFFTPVSTTQYLDIEMEFDGWGNLYLLVNIGLGDVDVDPGPSTHILTTSAGSGDVGLIKLDPNMNFLWAFAVGGAGSDVHQALAIDQQGNAVITGGFRSSFDLDPGPNSTNYTAMGSYDLAYAKYSPLGELLHSGMFGSFAISGQEAVSDCEIDNYGDIYFSGIYYGSGDFDPSPGVSMISSTSTIGSYLIRLRSDGSFVWVKQWDGNPWMWSIGIDAKGHVYTALDFSYPMDMDPGVGVANATVAGWSKDIMLLELDTNGNLVSMIQIGAQGNDHTPEITVGPTGIITIGGVYQHTVDFDPGPSTGSLTSPSGSTGHFIARYGSCLPYQGSIQLTSCAPVTLYGVTLPGPGHYDVVVSQASLCDSVYHVAIAPGLSSSGSLSLTGCNDIVVNSQSYTSSGTYTQHLTNVDGCDSTLTLMLTIDTIDTQVFAQGQSLVAAQAGATYQWLDCDSSFRQILGETQQSFTPQLSGNYAVIVNNGNCQDTSQCQPVILQGVKAHPLDAIRAWPNPGSGLVNVILPEDLSGSLHLSVINSQGQILQQWDAAPGSQLQFSLPAIAGIYLLQVVSEAGSSTLPLVRQ